MGIPGHIRTLVLSRSPGPSYQSYPVPNVHVCTKGCRHHQPSPKRGTAICGNGNRPPAAQRQGESQPMQIQQVLAVTGGHREKRRRETAIPFELVHERGHLSARRPAPKGSPQRCELLRLQHSRCLGVKRGGDQALSKPRDNSQAARTKALTR